MENRRPDFIDLRSKSQASFSRPLKSPRLHVAGEVPPELSPLDALRLQSQLLSKKLEEESTKQGRRMSRLPPLTTESPLVIQGRSDYFRSLSHDSGSEDGETAGLQLFGPGQKPDVEDDVSQRPVSVHPRMSRIPPTPDASVPLPSLPNMMVSLRKEQGDVEERDNFFGVGARREQSPTPIERSSHNPPIERLERLNITRSATQESLPQQSPVSTYSMASSPEKLTKMNSFEAAGLLPPRPSFSKRSSSVISSQESIDGDGLSSLGTSIHSQGPRKFSTSSGVLSPGLGPAQRSPSIASDTSALPRPSFNFSRPLSRAGTPVLDPPVRQASSDSQASFLFADDSVHTPVSMTGDGFDGNADDGKGAPSYIYSKFTLPRGKALQRSPELEESASSSFPFSVAGQPPPSPPTRPSSSSGTAPFGESYTRPSFEPSKLSAEVSRPAQQPTPDPSRPSADGARLSDDVPRGRALTSPLHDAARGKTPMSTATSDSASTIKPSRSLHSNAPTMTDLSAEEHVEKAVELHESNSLQESAWHLRHAAKLEHPTGMLLYALACRHGWGMRPNAKEGVEWLRKAAECASLEIADDENRKKEGKTIDVGSQKTRKAQFALSIYELGVSHMNGWGIEQDKALALRCFEIAGCKSPPKKFTES